MGFLFDNTHESTSESAGYFFHSRVLVIRFQRAGRKKSPFYRIVVAEKARSVKGRFIERVGHYNPLSNPKEISLKSDRIEHWISVGATPSQTAARLFSKNGIKAAEKFIEERVMKPSKAEEKAKKEAEEKAEAAKKEAEEKAEAAKKEAEEKAEAKEEGKPEEISTENSNTEERPEEKSETENAEKAS